MVLMMVIPIGCGLYLLSQLDQPGANTRVTESGDIRITESGDERIVE